MQLDYAHTHMQGLEAGKPCREICNEAYGLWHGSIAIAPIHSHAIIQCFI
jgi:hypothetical protein